MTKTHSLPAVVEQAQLDARGIDRMAFDVLAQTIWPDAKSERSVLMAWDYCKARQLDPFKKPVHLVPVYSSRAKGMVDTVWPGIAELRTTAHRTGEYAGSSEPKYGPLVKKTFEGSIRTWEKGQQVYKEGQEVTLDYPESCTVVVTRLVKGKPAQFVGVAWWIETYARQHGKTEIPNDMWRRRIHSQLAKCAEAEALRKAFPEELGGMATSEEMSGQQLMDDHHGPTIDHEPTPEPPPDEPKSASAPSAPSAAAEQLEDPDALLGQPAEQTAKVMNIEIINGDGEITYVGDWDAYAAEMNRMAREETELQRLHGIWDSNKATLNKDCPRELRGGIKDTFNNRRLDLGGQTPEEKAAAQKLPEDPPAPQKEVATLRLKFVGLDDAETECPDINAYQTALAVLRGGLTAEQAQEVALKNEPMWTELDSLYPLAISKLREAYRT